MAPSARRYAVAAIMAAGAGCGLHFLYDALPNPLTALISPINESVWEHLKLLYFPTLAAALVLSARDRLPQRFWSGFFAALLVPPTALCGAFYLLGAGFCVESTVLDILLYFIAMFLGFYMAYRLRKSGRWAAATPWLLLPVTLYGAALILFSFAAPDLPIFLAPL